jgi:hypothetical protein
MLSIPHCLGKRHTDGGEIVRLTRWPRFTHKNIFWYSFLLGSEWIGTAVRLEGLGELILSKKLIFPELIKNKIMSEMMSVLK